MASSGFNEEGHRALRTSPTAAGPTAARSYHWCTLDQARHPTPPLHRPPPSFVLLLLFTVCRLGPAAKAGGAGGTLADQENNPTGRTPRRRSPAFRSTPQRRRHRVASSCRVHLLVASNQPAIAQKATSFTMNWINLASYDVPGCANQCTNTVGCRSFDVYFQRSPTVAPSTDNSCPNPPSQCHIVCLLYNGTFTTADFINTGEWRGQFQGVIAGSNVFNKVGP